MADLKLKELLLEKEKRLAQNLNANLEKQSKWRAFLRPSGYKPLIILFFLFVIQQFSGVYITLFYAVTFLEVCGLYSIPLVVLRSIYFLGNRNHGGPLSSLNFRWRCSIYHVPFESLAVEVFQASPFTDDLFSCHGPMYVCFGSCYDLDPAGTH
jgi:hypothetical protein